MEPRAPCLDRRWLACGAPGPPIQSCSLGKRWAFLALSSRLLALKLAVHAIETLRFQRARTQRSYSALEILPSRFESA